MTSARDARRKEILKELGLTPVWRARATHQPESTSQASTGQSTTGEPDCSAPVDAAADRRLKILRMDWDELETSVAGCIACPLCHSRTRTVFGVGDQSADWLYVGEGPGAQEDATGEPFV